MFKRFQLLKSGAALLSALFVILTCAGCPGDPTPSYTWEDLNQQLQKDKGSFTFDNSNKPSEAVADLPYFIPNQELGLGWLRGVKTLQLQDVMTFPWDELAPKLRRGDIVFQRTGGEPGYLIRWFSSFTHVSLVWDIKSHEAFESLKSKGVNTYDTNTSWGNTVTFAVKMVKNLSESRVVRAMENAKSAYAGRIPYFPRASTRDMTKPEYVRKWSNKWDKDSMYCSKLVWWTFYPEGINLDSNRTRSITYGESDVTDRGKYVKYAWVGVSPDDIYYSNQLGKDITLKGDESLNSPLPWWMF